MLLFLHHSTAAVSHTVWAALWSLLPSIFFCTSLEIFCHFVSSSVLFQTAAAAVRRPKNSSAAGFFSYQTPSCNMLVGSISRSNVYFYEKCHKLLIITADADRNSFEPEAVQLRFSYLRWRVAVVTLATRCSSAELVAVATGGGGLWGWRWQRRWWWPGRRRGCCWTGGLPPPLRSDWILARWLAWRRWAVGLSTGGETGRRRGSDVCLATRSHTHTHTFRYTVKDRWSVSDLQQRQRARRWRNTQSHQHNQSQQGECFQTGFIFQLLTIFHVSKYINLIWNHRGIVSLGGHFFLLFFFFFVEYCR